MCNFAGAAEKGSGVKLFSPFPPPISPFLRGSQPSYFFLKRRLLRGYTSFGGTALCSPPTVTHGKKGVFPVFWCRARGEGKKLLFPLFFFAPVIYRGNLLQSCNPFLEEYVFCVFFCCFLVDLHLFGTAKFNLSPFNFISKTFNFQRMTFYPLPRSGNS